MDIVHEVQQLFETGMTFFKKKFQITFFLLFENCK